MGAMDILKSVGQALTSKETYIGSVSVEDCLPSNGFAYVNEAYVMTLYIKNENNVAVGDDKSGTDIEIITAYCPKELNLNFSNTYDSIDPMKLTSGGLINGAFQTFAGRSTVFNINNVRVWTSSKPLSLSIDLDLYATAAEGYNDQNNKVTDEKLLKILQKLASLAQPKRIEGTGWLKPPGPSPARIKYLKATTKENSSAANATDVSKKTVAYTEGFNGVDIEIQYGKFFRLSHVIVTGVDIKIPYVMGKHTLTPEELKALNNLENNQDNLVDSQYSEEIAKNSLTEAENNVSAFQKALDNAKKEQSNKTIYELELKNLQSDLARLTSELNALQKSGASREIIAAKQAEINAVSTRAKNLETKIAGLDDAVKQAEARVNQNKEEIKTQSQKLNKTKDTQVSLEEQIKAGGQNVNYAKKTPKPIMAHVTLHVETKQMVTQKDFEDMINFREQENVTEIDLTKYKTLSAGVDLVNTGTKVLRE